jgi:hypothetical protein
MARRGRIRAAFGVVMMMRVRICRSARGGRQWARIRAELDAEAIRGSHRHESDRDQRAQQQCRQREQRPAALSSAQSWERRH